MKKFFAGIITLSLFLNLSAAAPFSMTAGKLGLKLNGKGELTELYDTASGKNYLASAVNKNWKSSLLKCKQYGGNEEMPEQMTVLKKNAGSALLKFNYKSGVALTVKLQVKSGYFRMELVDAAPLKNIDCIVWGPYKTSMRGPIAEWIGFNRSDNFTIGCLSLEPNTDGRHGYDPISASYEGFGSQIALYSHDHTKPREFRKWMTSTPINVTVKGSAVALFGVPRSRKYELDMIEKIELAEKLPHPTFLGKWNKRTPAVQKISIWIGLDQNNAEHCIQLCKNMHAGTVCRMHGYYANWGHFDIDKHIFPGGYAAVHAMTDKAWKEATLKNTTYTLSGFLKPMSMPEPFITPVPDKRLAKFDPVSSLASPVSADDQTITLKKVKGLTEIYKGNSRKVICIDNEMIEFKTMDEDGETLLIKGAERGAFKTKAEPHKPGTPVTYMYVSGYHNFYPGTVDMNNEMASYIGRDAQKCGNGVIILDGYESCFETGHSEYALNTFAKTIYDMGGEKDRLMAYSLTQGNYNWHMMSYQSWGEYQLERGFRGTCLDYRIMRQIQYHNNLVPNKMGQYYPTNATTEDIEWLMARVCGWESGVDFNVNLGGMVKNPEYNSICSALGLWEEARMKKIFTAQQKMFLRQTDRLYHLEKSTDGKLKLKFVKFWQHKGVKISSPSVFSIEGKQGTVKPCSIKWAQTHNPAIFAECGLSDDLLLPAGDDKAEWNVTVPAGNDNRLPKEQHLLPVVRLGKNAKFAVKNIRISANGAELLLPVTLNPGEYISIPHNTKLGCVYDAKTNNVKREFYLLQFNPYWYLPNLKRGQKNKITIKCEFVTQGKKSDVILNLRYWNDILSKR